MLKFLTILATSLAIFTSSLYAADQVVILSPHRKSIQNEFIPAFKEFYKKTYGTEVNVEWLDQGGTNEGVKFLRTKFAGNAKTSGVDIFWGGGTTPYVELNNSKLLDKFNLPKGLEAQLPATAAGVPMRDASKTWYASAISSFGIFYNKKLMTIEKLPQPKTWTDLAQPAFFKKVVQTDPRKSGTANQMNQIMLQSLGWQKGFEVLTALAGNSNEFTQSSSDPIKAVVGGAASATPAIDFYALAKVGDLGPDNLGFVLPEKKTILDPDPIAILKGAPNRKAAERFIEWTLSAEAQNIFMLPKGAPGGPKLETLGRMAVNTESYKQTAGKNIVSGNPFTMPPFFKMNVEKAAKNRLVFDDLVGALLVDTHKDLKRAWEKVIKEGSKPEAVAALAKPPISEADFDKLSEKWSDNVFRNKTINEWVEFAKKKYNSIAGNS